MGTDPTVFIVDDDAGTRDSTQFLVKSAGLSAECYSTAHAFLEGYEPHRPGCLVLDVCMPGLSGLDLQEQLKARGILLPVIIITGHAEIPMAVRALKCGAREFLEKPFVGEILLGCIRDAIAEDALKRIEHARRMEIVARFALLTQREEQVMKLVIRGKANKQIATDLYISQKTVEAHRKQVMDKTQADSVAELVRLAQIAGVEIPPTGDDQGGGP